MDVRFINPFINAVCNTLQTMCNLEVSVGKPVVKTADDPGSDVSSVIGFSGDAAGSLVLHFRFETASKIASAFAGMEITQEHTDFADAIGELANMVAGGAKAKFDGLTVNISLPNVIIGRNHSVSASKSTPRLVIPCKTDAGTFQMEMAMEPIKSNSPSVRTATAGVHT